MRRRNKVKIFAFLVVVTCMVTSCGRRYPAAPELIEPKAANESYRMVSYGDIGDVEIAFGTVVPTEYCHFWKTTVNVAEIKVDIGDKVSAGDVLATADIKSVNETIDDIQAQIQLAQSIKAENDKKYELQKQELTYRFMGCQELGDTEGANAVSVQLSVVEENQRYDNLLYQHNIGRLNKNIAEQQEIIENGMLVARTGGYVSYVKDISLNNQVSNYENVVVISDYDDCYVEMQEETVESKILNKYPMFYTSIDGKKYNLVEYAYSSDELLVAQSREKYPNIRLRFEDETAMPQTGCSVPVICQKSLAENVLIVGNDSLYHDEKGSFVYVKNEDSKEVRYVELGVSDTYNTEVVSGLEEGELVYYSSESVLPENYIEYPVESDTYIAREYTDSYVLEDTQRLRYFSDYEGQVEEVMVKEGAQISEGDLICTIRTNEGSARLAEMSNEIKNYKSDYEKSCKDYELQIADIEKQMAECLHAKDDTAQANETGTATDTDAMAQEDGAESALQPGVLATDTDAEEIQMEPYRYEELSCQLEQVRIDRKIAEINYNYQLAVMQEEYAEASCNNDGTGVVRIYADRAGKLTNVSIKAGKKLEIGSKMFNIEIPANEKVVLRSNKPLEMNQPVTFIDEESGKSYEGKVSGSTGTTSGEKFYLTTIDDKVYVTESVSGNSERYYVNVDNDAFFELDKKCMAEYSTNTIENTVVLPRGMVYTEVNPYTLEDAEYVWKIENGSLVKQYVKTISCMVDGETIYCIIKGVEPGDVLAQERYDIGVIE